jgi:hypothetical protein
MYIQLKNYIDNCVLQIFNWTNINAKENQRIFKFGNALTVDDITEELSEKIKNCNNGDGYYLFDISFANIIYTFINKDNPIFDSENQKIKYLHLIQLYIFSANQQIVKYLDIISFKEVSYDKKSYKGELKKLDNNITISIYNNTEENINMLMEIINV